MVPVKGGYLILHVVLSVQKFVNYEYKAVLHNTKDLIKPLYRFQLKTTKHEI